MRLLFTGSSVPPEATFKRLLMIADEIAVMDRPSVTFGDWGTIGSASPLRLLIPTLAETPVKLVAYSPPSGPVTELYQRYIQADLENAEFKTILLEGLARDETFAGKLVQMEAQYPSGPRMLCGRDLLKELVSDAALSSTPLDERHQPGNLFNVEDERGRRSTLRIIAIEASINLTNAMVVSNRTGHLPVTDDPFTARLLALRSTTAPYVGGSRPLTAAFGLAIAKAVIPDAALSRLRLSDILEYRRTAKDAYSAWAVELNKLAAALDEVPASEAEGRIARMIATDVTPRLREYRNQMRSARDRLFADLLKEVTKWEVPTLSLAYLTDLGLHGAIAAFVALVRAAAPPVIEYLRETRDTRRKHALSYLIGLTEDTK